MHSAIERNGQCDPLIRRGGALTAGEKSLSRYGSSPRVSPTFNQHPGQAKARALAKGRRSNADGSHEMRCLSATYVRNDERQSEGIMTRTALDLEMMCCSCI